MQSRTTRERAARGAAAAPGRDRPVAPERAQFRALLLQNPNYFGNLETSVFKPVKKIQTNTGFEELVCLGLHPPFDRLEAVIHVKQESGYGGDICSPGSFEYVRFYVDLHDNGVWHDVGQTKVRVYNIPGDKSLCYAVKKDFDAFRRLCFTENIVKVRAILSWDVPPPPNTPNFIPVFGNRLDVQVQIHPRPFIIFDDLLKGFEQIKSPLPDPIGPIVQSLDPQAKIAAIPTPALALAEKKQLYRRKDVPVHRFAFTEAQEVLAAATPVQDLFTLGNQSLLQQLGLSVAEIGDLIGKIQVITDGDTSFEELRCVGLRPQNDLLEGVLTVKKSSGYSGSLCTGGSTEYVAFWMDFQDGSGFHYMGTATVQVHDLNSIPAGGLQYAVFLHTNLSAHIEPCEAGAKLARLRAILSWETAPPPGNPNYVPTWGNREECLVQLRPGEGTGHVPIIETVGDMGVDDINQVTGLATGQGVLAALTANQSPFGAVVTITGRIGNPPDSFGGGAARFKYKIEVSPASVDDWHPLTNKVAVKISEMVGGIPQECDPGEFVCDRELLATDDGDGLGDGWYEYMEDLIGPAQRFLVVDKLASWVTDATMEGLWKIRITAKNPVTGDVFPGFQEVRVRIDNTAPTASLAITGATFNGNPIPAEDCGKFPVGTILTGTYEVHDPGTTSPNQHFGGWSLDVIPDGPANGAAPVPSSGSFPVVPTTGEAGTWTLDTSNPPPGPAGGEPMDACGYVLRLLACDRTIVNSGSVGFCTAADVGFCLEEPEG